MILLFFGLTLIGSAFILGAWWRQGWRNRLPVSIYNAALFLAIGMDLHAAGIVLTHGGRIWQILADGAVFATESWVYGTGAVLILAGKTIFVWIASMGEGETYSRRLWWSYWGAVAAWTAFTWSWYA